MCFKLKRHFSYEILVPKRFKVNHWLSQGIKIPPAKKLGQVALVALSVLITAPRY